MKFKGNGIVWSPEENKALCKFTKGSLETEDPALITKLKTLGYKQIIEEETELLDSNEDQTQPEEIDAPEQTQTTENQNTISDDFKELRQLAKEKGIAGYMNKTKVELQNLLYPKEESEQ